MIDTNFDDLVQQMAARRDQLQAEIDAAMDAHGVICRAHDLLAGTATIVTAKAATITGSDPAPAREREVRDVKSSDVACPECGQTCASKQGLAVHRSHKHKAPSPSMVAATERRATATTADAADAAVGAVKPTKQTMVLACTECEFECAITEAGKLTHHALSSHNRRASTEERQPVPAATSAA